ncbi:MAG: glycosyl transferase family 2 [Thermoleophilia bacterium]|nr:glycosyl transferase family 2 [Thermoleophilia bacterium]
MTVVPADRPLTSIVILVRNGLETTRACVASIRRWTPEPYELVFVDNASTDGTGQWLRELEGAVIIDNDHNLGFGGGCNQGMAASVGERVLLLNNDVVVTDGWLAVLHDALDTGAAVGLAGPRSNRVAGTQEVPDIGYDTRSLDGLDQWAATWTAAHRGATGAVPRLVGFCLLLERAVIDRIGGFDLRYGIGNFEDDDICLRAAVAGFDAVIAHGSFVHHVGSHTFAAEGIDYGASMSENLGRFMRAWDMDAADVDMARGGYDATRVIARTTWDPARHHAPLVAVPDTNALVDLDGRATVVVVCCDRVDPVATDESLRAALRCVGPQDDVTVAIRIDPRDARSPGRLEAIADEVGDDRLPDVVVLEARDENDLPVLRRATHVVAHGRFARARADLARLAGAVPVSLDELAALATRR